MLWYYPGNLTRRNIYGIRLDCGEIGFQHNCEAVGFHMSLKACAYRKNGVMLLPRGIARCSVRQWRV